MVNGHSDFGWCITKYAYAMEPEQTRAAGRVNRPTSTRLPPTSWMTAAHQLGHTPKGTDAPVPRAPPSTPNSDAAPWLANNKPTTRRNADSAGPDNRDDSMSSPLRWIRGTRAARAREKSAPHAWVAMLGKPNLNTNPKKQVKPGGKGIAC